MMRSSLLALGLLGACGKVVPPATTDAPPDIDADPRGTVRVTVLDVVGNGALAANIPVVFHDPDGTVVASVTSDSAGRAEARVLPGASVTAVWPQGQRFLVGTITDLKPGDDLPMGFTRRDSTNNGTFQVTFSALPTASSYEIFTPCGQTSAMPGTTTTIQMRNDCRRDTFDVYVVAFTNGLPSDYAQLQNVQLSQGAATIPNNWSNVSDFSATYSNIPADVTGISSNRASGMLRGFSSSTGGTPANNTLALSLQNVPTAGSKAIVQTVASRADGMRQVITQRIAGNAVNYTLNVGMQLTPWLTAMAFDAGTLTLTPTVEGAFTGSDLFGADLQFSRDTLNIEWIVINAAPGPLRLPVLPADVGPVMPQPGDLINALAGIVVDASTLASYDAARTEGVFDVIEFGIIGTDQIDLVKTQLVFTQGTPRRAGATMFGGLSASSTQ